MLSLFVLLAAVNIALTIPHDPRGILHNGERDFNATLFQPRATTITKGSFKSVFFGNSCRSTTCTKRFRSQTPQAMSCFIRSPLCSSDAFFSVNGNRICDRAWVVVRNQRSITVKVRTSKRRGYLFVVCFVTAEDSTATTTTADPATTTTTTTPSTPTARCVCGKLNQGTRIVGGTAAQIHEYPYQVGLKSSPRSTQIYCGGSIISTEWIITAAHCTRGTAASSIYVTVGEHNRASTSETSVTQTIQVSRKVEHPNYNTNTLANDISLLRLSQSLTFDSDNKIAPICMPELTGPPVGTPLIVTGWGTTSSGGSQPNALREVTVFSVSQSVCNNVYGTITSSQICAADTGKDSCQGDSGGPLVALNGNNYELTGVVSFGNGCAIQGFPGVYAKVISYESWINSITGTLDTCPKA